MFDNHPYIGSRLDKKYKIVEVRQSKGYTIAYDSFIFAQQAKQVYYTTYPEGHRGWLAVMKIKSIRCVNKFNQHIKMWYLTTTSTFVCHLHI